MVPSKTAFRFRSWGGALIETIKTIEFVERVEVLFVTSSKSEVLALKPLADRVRQITGAMNKMSTEMALDCQSCPYTDVCRDVAGLRALRRAVEKRDA
jgi:hypothetical protein